MNETMTERVADAEQGYVVGLTGLTMLRDLTRDEWAALGQLLRQRSEGYQWALGDWLVYGGGRGSMIDLDRDGHGRWLGSSYELAMQITGYAKSYLSMLYGAATVFPPDSRTIDVPWRIYERVSHQPDYLRTELLRLAEEHRWYVRELEEHLIARAAQARTAAGPTAEAQTAAAGIRTNPSRVTAERLPKPRRRVQCPKCFHVFPVTGHETPAE